MSSGHGVDKPRMEEHPNRQVGPHFREKWRPTNAISGPMGKVTAHANPGGSPYMAAWEGPGGHRAEVDVHTDVSGGYESSSYQAGPYRTGMRAQIAAEAIANRIEGGGDVDQYHTGDDFTSDQEMRWEQEGLL